MAQQPRAGAKFGGAVISGVIAGLLLYLGLAGPLGTLAAAAAGIAGMFVVGLLAYWVISQLAKWDSFTNWIP